jgi:hypothetical protein
VGSGYAAEMGDVDGLCVRHDEDSSCDVVPNGPRFTGTFYFLYVGSIGWVRMESVSTLFGRCGYEGWSGGE